MIGLDKAQRQYDNMQHPDYYESRDLVALRAVVLDDEDKWLDAHDRARAELDALNRAGLPDDELDAKWADAIARQEAAGIFV